MPCCLGDPLSSLRRHEYLGSPGVEPLDVPRLYQRLGAEKLSGQRVAGETGPSALSCSMACVAALAIRLPRSRSSRHWPPAQREWAQSCSAAIRSTSRSTTWCRNPGCPGPGRAGGPVQIDGHAAEMRTLVPEECGGEPAHGQVFPPFVTFDTGQVHNVQRIIVE